MQPPPPEPPKPRQQKYQDGGPVIEPGKKVKDYWMPGQNDMVKCPPGGERQHKLTKTSYCNQTCKFRRGCFVHS